MGAIFSRDPETGALSGMISGITAESFAELAESAGLSKEFSASLGEFAGPLTVYFTGGDMETSIIISQNAIQNNFYHGEDQEITQEEVDDWDSVARWAWENREEVLSFAPYGKAVKGGVILFNSPKVKGIITSLSISRALKTERSFLSSSKGTLKGRAGKQKQLRTLLNDDKVSSADRGWLKQDLRQIQRGKRQNLRVPVGKELAHKRGFEASKGFDYSHTKLQDKSLHKLQHKYDGMGKKNKKVEEK